MNTKTMTALAVLMLAATTLPAAAQERGPDRGERPHRGWDRGGEAARAPEAAQAPAAPEAPRAPQARRADEAQADLWRSDRRRGEPRPGPDMRRPGRWTDNDGDDRAEPSPADRADREDRDEARDARRWNGGNVQWDGRDLRYGDRRDGDRRDGRDDHRRGWDGRWSRDDRDRWNRDDRDRDRRRGDRPYWSQGRYPFSYHSHRRYRGSRWIAPPGFYVRSWSHGDYLPWGWYSQSYRLNDWWAYGLPWPPPGFDWVRVGPDVLLVDRFNGRIVQVVRMVFW